MKKILSLTLLCCLISQIAFSQEYFKKGSNILTGGLNGNVSNSENNDDYLINTTKNRSSGLSINYGRFIKDNLVIGVGLGYSKSNQTYHVDYSDTSRNGNDQIRKSSSIRSNIFARKYFPVNERFGAYISSSLYYDKSKNTNIVKSQDGEYGEYMYNANTIGVSAGLGIYYFVLNKVSLSLNIGDIGFRHYFSDEVDYDSIGNASIDNNRSSKSSGFNVSLVNQISFDQFFTINYHF